MDANCLSLNSLKLILSEFVKINQISKKGDKLERILVTGAAGFIGSALVCHLLEKGELIIGVDNHNSYYDPELKLARVARFSKHQNYSHQQIDISSKEEMSDVFAKYNPRKVVNLAAQAGVRYSIENPDAYINSNIVGFSNILELCRFHEVEHLVYASSSSVYGSNTKMPFSTRDSVDHPISLYAASKKSNELMAHAYSYLYDLPCTGLRFFTVYGPWGRPDMALFKFANAILKGEKIQLYNYGNHLRDFTYIDDIIDGIDKVLGQPPMAEPMLEPSLLTGGNSKAPWRIFNIGNSNPVELKTFLSTLESALGKKAVYELLPLQLGDVPDTFADITDMKDTFNYEPKVSVEEGVSRFVEWFIKYYGF